MRLTQREACRTIAGLLELAAWHGVEADLAGRLDAGAPPDLEQLRDEFAPRQADCPQVVVELPCAALYDGLLDHEVVT